MQTDKRQPEATSARVIAGYLISVTFGALAFVFSLMLRGAGQFESATANPLDVKAAHFSIMFVLLFGLSWMFALGISALPCVGIACIARTFSIRNRFFYLLAGLAIGVLAVLAFVEISNSFTWYTDSPDEKATTCWQGLRSVGRIFVPTGAFAGLLFWWIAGRFYRSTGGKPPVT
ncbi:MULTISPECIES: hypothetical protein [unclassified Paraburkholderia]|uniref:hypothetical protein n=1 Tax=unclassified Paraburkholderia TaxID=2615204 RepID=UPI002AAFCC84|nr:MULTISPECIES: hypothetical protein [unclassified Paraburkholderia]